MSKDSTIPRQSEVETRYAYRWDVELNIPDMFNPADAFDIQLAWTELPIGGYLSVQTAGPVNFDIPEFQVSISTMAVNSQMHSGLALPYNTTVTVYWHQESYEKLQFPDPSHFDVSFVRCPDSGVDPATDSRNKKRVGEAKQVPGGGKA